MDEFFKLRTLITAVNALRKPGRRIYQRHFMPKERMDVTDLLGFDIITGSEGVLSSISVFAPATITEKIGRKAVKMTAPRLSQKRMIPAAALNAIRSLDDRFMPMMMEQRIRLEMEDMRNLTDRTIEFWAANAIRGKIYDANMTTVLVDYNLPVSHKPTLVNNDRWTAAESDPIAHIRGWKKIIEDDSGHEITGWCAWVGGDVMDALLGHAKVRELLKYDRGSAMAESGRIERLADVELLEYNGSFMDENNTRQRYIPANSFILIGEGADVFDCPYAPIVDDEAPGGVGNVDQDGNGLLYFSKSWPEKDPSGRWIKTEARPLPVVKYPLAIVFATVRA